MKVLITWRVPKTVQWLIKVFFIYLAIFTAFRIATVVFFKPVYTSFSDLLPAFWLGLKYDLRWISFLIIPIAFFSLFPRLSPFFSERGKKFWTVYLGMVTLLVLFFYGADFGQFSYLSARLNADALVYAQKPKESLQMVWQTYPVIWILIGIGGALLMMTWLFKRGYKDVQTDNNSIHKFDYKRRWSLLSLVVLAWFMFGFFTAGPLRFDRAFNLNSDFTTNLALNPLQNFYTTLRFTRHEPAPDAKKYYPVITGFLEMGKPLKGEGPYSRMGKGADYVLETRPNIVLVICESFSVYKSGLGGNKLNTTPYMDQLARESIYFDRCFAPAFGTARGIFALLTGVPDVQQRKFSMQNPETVRQHAIINSFSEYNKLYFLGGRSNFNNLNSLLENIYGIEIYDGEKLSSPSFNVWGVSDKNMMLEADKIMAAQKKPFFSIIQMANNQRPYAIPTEDSAFQNKGIRPDELKANGFESVDEYRAYCYADFCIARFMEAARKQPYFSNTLFVFTSDHGLEGTAGDNFPKAWSNQRLSELHIPFFLYAPALIPPAIHHRVVSQIDIIPTIASLVQQPYVNTSLGRNVLDKEKKNDVAFTISPAQGWIGIVTNDYYFRKNLHMPKEEMVKISSNGNEYTHSQLNALQQRLSQLADAFYETSRWLLYHNAQR